MKLRWVFFCSVLWMSCQNDNSTLLIEQQKEAKKKEAIFNTINRGWEFDIAPMEPQTMARIGTWNEWRNFLREVNQKPKSTLSAFQKKATVLVAKSNELLLGVPQEFNKPQVRARIMVINTKLKSMDLYIHLNQIPDDKVVQLVGEVNTEIEYLQLQLEEIVQRSLIPREEGEPDFQKMKDTTRAIPNTPINH
ncbi:hypothetical protein [Flavobacterium stagni]|uniref:Uncharacterized protein n=1 Tax=Flavobacterium stagni TaxID=2506421 RepID=A0A4Q1KDX2_9FLAO|nr:hypothetical protein [Flavobacterium stagni]RXR24463.1 hypothetical protein EQG61_03170 [Flavobacterium stagni]